MGYGTDKLEIANAPQPEDDIPRASLRRISEMWGSGDLESYNKQCPSVIVIIGGMGKKTVWELDGDQPGVNWKNKMYRCVKKPEQEELL